MCLFYSTLLYVVHGIQCVVEESYDSKNVANVIKNDEM